MLLNVLFRDVPIEFTAATITMEMGVFDRCRTALIIHKAQN
jgi:hypothetical protein